MKKVDIIIPIYNAYDCLKTCIDSVIKNTDLKSNRLILIDDKSTDKRVLKLLKEYAKKNKSIKIIQNEENYGFVKTVNIGMSLSKNDVLLLNSDTEVTKKWLEKIGQCAYKDDLIATVTPLSNNATQFSVPYMFRKNELNKKTTLEEMNKIIEETSYKDYPEVPTAHGFCIYIKREVLDIIGLFDYDKFGRGYGEENDFCYRCSEAGYIHVLADDTYIFHKESQSFNETKEAQIKLAEKQLEIDHPVKCFRNFEFIDKRVIDYIGKNTSYAVGYYKNHKKNILMLIHDWNLECDGGTTAHLFDIVNNLKDQFNIHILAPSREYYTLHSYIDGENNYLDIKDVKNENYNTFNMYNRDYKELIKEIIETFSIDLIHIHHLMKHYFDVFDVAKEENVETIVTLHDFFSICPKYTLVEENYGYCENKRDCSKCLLNRFSSEKSAGIFIKNWRSTWYKKLINVNKIIVPSISTKEIVNKQYKRLKIDVIEHGTELKSEKSNLSIESNKDFNIAFVGRIFKEKGADYLKGLLEQKELDNIKIHLFGATDLKLPNNNNFKDHGIYKREELTKLLKENDIKVVCLLASWPETFSYTLSEAIASGIPVLGIDVGAIGSRVKKDDLGWLLNLKCTNDELFNKIKEIKNNKKDYLDKIENINNYHLLSTKEMTEKYKKIYQKNKISNTKISTEKIKKFVKDNTKVDIIIINNHHTSYEWILHTLKWRIISKVKIPKKIKKIIRK